MRIPFNKAPVIATSLPYMQDALENKVSGDGKYTELCSRWMAERFASPKVQLTTSASHALEMAAHLCGVGPGDEVILPSYTFSSTANAFVGRGATLVFVDIRPDTMNLDETLVEAAITPKTRVLVPMHYAGVACEMDELMDIAHRHNLLVVEDAAQGVMSQYKGRPLGSIGHYGCYSFHETKNYSMGEGGALLIQDAATGEAAEIMREKGTDRSRFFRGQVDKYSWQDWGSSYLPSDLNAAYLWSQLEMAEEINRDRLSTWNAYHEAFLPLAARGLAELPHVPGHCVHNAHMFYLKLAGLDERSRFIAHLKARGIWAVYHYVPLHSAPAGIKYGRFYGEDVYTTRESERLVRLPLYYGIGNENVASVIDAVLDFFN